MRPEILSSSPPPDQLNQTFWVILSCELTYHASLAVSGLEDMIVMKWVKGHERCKPRLLWGQEEATSSRVGTEMKSLGTFGGDDTELLSKKQECVLSSQRKEQEERLSQELAVINA